MARVWGTAWPQGRIHCRFALAVVAVGAGADVGVGVRGCRTWERPMEPKRFCRLLVVLGVRPGAKTALSGGTLVSSDHEMCYAGGQIVGGYIGGA
jgi:hypothetical protein